MKEFVAIDLVWLQDGLMQLLFAMLCLEAIVEAGASGDDDPVSSE